MRDARYEFRDARCETRAMKDVRLRISDFRRATRDECQSEIRGRGYRISDVTDARDNNC